MTKKLKDYKNVRLNGPDGTQSPVFSTGAEAEQWYKTNYPTGYKVVEQQSEPTYQGKTLPEVTVTANAPVDYDQLQDARRQIINGNYYGKKFVPTPQNVAHYLNLMNKDRQVANATDPSEWAKFAVGNVLPVASAIPLAGMTIPAAIGTAIGGVVGGVAGDKAGQALHHTFVDPNTSIGEYTAKLWNNSRPFGVKLPNISSSTGELANLGTWIGGAYGGSTPSRVRESAYQYITPIGYGDSPFFGVVKGRDIGNFLINTFNPFIKYYSKENPAWHKRSMKYFSKHPRIMLGEGEITPASVIDFRKEAFDLALHPDTYSGKLYVRTGTAPNGDPIYDYNYDEVNRIRQAGGSPTLDKVRYFIKGNYNSRGIKIPYQDMQIGQKVSVLGHDIPSSNGGYAPLEFTPIEDGSFPPYRVKDGYLGKPAIHIRDRWDVQPFQDPERLTSPLAKAIAKVPGLKNMEIVNLLGGKPFVLDTTIPEGNVALFNKYN